MGNRAALRRSWLGGPPKQEGKSDESRRGEIRLHPCRPGSGVLGQSMRMLPQRQESLCQHHGCEAHLGWHVHRRTEVQHATFSDLQRISLETAKTNPMWK